MKVFELKRNIDLKWEDIPFVECPVFATTHAMNALIHPSDPSSQVTNIREFIVNELGVYDPLRNHNYAEERVNSLMGFGHYFSICRSGKPFIAAFTWKEDKDHPHQGVWTDPLDHYWMSPNRIKNLLAEIANEWHRVQTQSYMEELMDSPYAIARAVEDEYLAIPKAKKEIAVKPVAVAVMPSAKAIEPAKTAIPVQKNESTQSGSSFKLLKGKYGSAKNYGNKIVVNDLEEFYKNNTRGIYVASQGNNLECYNVANGLGLPITSDVTTGAQLKKGMFLEKGTIIMFASKLNNGDIGYASSNPARYNYAPGKFSHLAIVSEDFTYDGTEIPVLHQYKRSEGLVYETVKNHSERSQNHAINNLDNAYVLKLKKE